MGGCPSGGAPGTKCTGAPKSGQPFFKDFYKSKKEDSGPTRQRGQRRSGFFRRPLHLLNQVSPQTHGWYVQHISGFTG